MIVLDTNVVSELMRTAPNPAVLSWLDPQPSAELFITSITAAELRSGVARLPVGRRRSELDDQVERFIAETFDGYCLPFTVATSLDYAAVVAQRRVLGQPIGAMDAQIAAICRQHAAVLATRNINDFAGVDLQLVDPWSAFRG